MKGAEPDPLGTGRHRPPLCLRGPDVYVSASTHIPPVTCGGPRTDGIAVALP